MPKRTKQADPFKQRLARARQRTADAHADWLLVSNPVDVGYLTGFLGGDSWLLLKPTGKPILISDSRYAEELGAFKPLVRVKMRSGAMTDAAAALLASGGFTDKRRKTKLGIQGEYMTLAGHKALAGALRKHKIKASALATTTDVIGPLRARKDAHEIRLIRKAARIAQDALLAVLPTIRPGQTELGICADLEAEMKARGSSESAFNPIVAAQAKGSLPHYAPSTTRTARNKPLLIDWGATWNGYRSDMTRAFTLGRWPRQIREIYQIVLDAHELAAAALKPGMTGAQVDAVARGHIKKHGYGRFFGHGLGHGLGMDVHESPSLSHRATKQLLEPGHVVTIEPGIYLPGIGGVRIEDDYLITERGRRNLCSLPKDLQWATL